MIAQLMSLFLFGLAITFIAFLGVLRARDFKMREMAERAAEAAARVRPEGPGSNLEGSGR